jgi:adenylate cyclase
MARQLAVPWQGTGGGSGVGLRAFLLGPDRAERLPARVVAAVRREQARSEIVVSCLQGLAIVTFAALYALSPKAFPPGVPFEPVPWALAAYALFTGVRLLLALRRQLPGWFLALSVVVDVAVLMVTIWSFHLQYRQPPAIILRRPR